MSKNFFLLFQKKLIFFTILNLAIGVAKKIAPNKVKNKSGGGEGPSCERSNQWKVYIAY